MARTVAAKFALTALLLGFGFGASTAVSARQPTDLANATTIAPSALPTAGRDTLKLIRDGGPFPYDKDGSVFGNRERQLPGAKRGYYREYTVRTPGARDRGARRIVCGGPARTPDACWYTADHYASFRQIDLEPTR